MHLKILNKIASLNFISVNIFFIYKFYYERFIQMDLIYLVFKKQQQQIAIVSEKIGYFYTIYKKHMNIIMRVRVKL